MPATRPETRVFIVSTGEVPTLHARRIEAAYYQLEDGYMTFKDADHKAVYSVRPDHLVSIERAHDAEPVTAALHELIREAARKGHAAGSIVAERTTDPDGRVYTTDYYVTVSTGASSERPDDGQHVTVEVKGDYPSEHDVAQAVDSAVRQAAATQMRVRR